MSCQSNIYNKYTTLSELPLLYSYLFTKLVEGVVGEEHEALLETTICIFSLNLLKHDALHRTFSTRFIVKLDLVVIYNGFQYQQQYHNDVYLQKLSHN